MWTSGHPNVIDVMVLQWSEVSRYCHPAPQQTVHDNLMMTEGEGVGAVQCTCKTQHKSSSKKTCDCSSEKKDRCKSSKCGNLQYYNTKLVRICCFGWESDSESVAALAGLAARLQKCGPFLEPNPGSNHSAGPPSFECATGEIRGQTGQG
jgi:hypothetical protein